MYPYLGVQPPTPHPQCHSPHSDTVLCPPEAPPSPAGFPPGSCPPGGGAATPGALWGAHSHTPWPELPWSVEAVPSHGMKESCRLTWLPHWPQGAGHRQRERLGLGGRGSPTRGISAQLGPQLTQGSPGPCFLL